MNSGFIYYFKTSTKNRIKNFKRKPLKSIGMLVLGIYFIFLPLFFKEMIKQINLDNPNGYISFIAITSIYLGMPLMLSYFKRKGLVFTEADVNFTFTSPTSPKQNILFAMAKNVAISIIQYAAFFIAAIYIFKIPFFKALMICMICLVLSNMINMSLVVIMYGSENISKVTKDIIKYLVYLILASLSALVLVRLINSGFSFESVSEVFTGNIILAVPIFGWEIGFLKLILVGPSIFNIAASICYFASAILLLVYTKRLKIKGEYYEDALTYSEEYTKVLNKSKKDGTIGWVGKKNKVKNIKFSRKGSYAKAIFYKQLDEFRKVSFMKKFGKILLYLALSIIIGILINGENPKKLDDIAILGIAYGVSIYFGIFFNKAQSWKNEYSNFYIYLFPDKPKNKLFYSTLIKNMQFIIEGIVLAVPISILLGLPWYSIFLNIAIYVSTQVMILYVDFILREIIGSKIGDNLAYMVMMGVDFLIVLLGGATAFLLYFLTGSIWPSFIILIVFLLGFACLGLSVSSNLYTNMEFVNE